MSQMYKDSQCSVKQKKILLDFAREMVEKRIFSRKQMHSLIHLARDEKNEELISLAKKLAKAREVPVTKAQDTAYHIQHQQAVNLNQQFVKGKFLHRHTRRKSIADLAEDLTAISANGIKNTHTSEFYHQAWIRNPEVAPNVAYCTNTINQIGDFVVYQMLHTQKAKHRKRLYAGLLQLTQELLEKHHDFSSVVALTARLNNPAITRLMPTKLTQQAVEFENLINPEGNYGMLRAEMNRLDEAGIPYIPYIGIAIKDFTSADDGNPDRIKKEINLNRLTTMAAIHKTFMAAQQNLEEKEDLHYDVPGEILNQSFAMNDNEIWEKSYALKRRGVKKQ